MSPLLLRLFLAQVVGYVPAAVLAQASPGGHNPNIGAPLAAMAGFWLATFLSGFGEARYLGPDDSGRLRTPTWRSATASTSIAFVVVLVLPASSTNIPPSAVLLAWSVWVLGAIGSALALVTLGFELGNRAEAPPW